jgi:hypothetical protein
MKGMITLLVLFTSITAFAQDLNSSSTTIKYVNIIDVKSSPIQTDMTVLINQ